MPICQYIQLQKCDVREHSHVIHQVGKVFYLLCVHGKSQKENNHMRMLETDRKLSFLYGSYMQALAVTMQEMAVII